jgi:hypothetical protein
MGFEYLHLLPLSFFFTTHAQFSLPPPFPRLLCRLVIIVCRVIRDPRRLVSIVPINIQGNFSFFNGSLSYTGLPVGVGTPAVECILFFCKECLPVTHHLPLENSQKFKEIQKKKKKNFFLYAL